MDSVATIYRSVRSLPSGNIYEVLDTYNIEVHYEPLLIQHGRQSMILSVNGRTVIFLRPSVDQRLVEFLLWHELAHYILHYHPNMRMNYILSTRRTETEMQANMFAVFGLLQDEDLSDRLPVEAAISKGVPAVIAADVIRTLAENRYRLA